MRNFVTEVAAVRKAIAETADAIPPLQRELSDTEALTHRYGFTLASDGKAQNHHVPQGIPEQQRDDFERERERARAEVTDRGEQILRHAEDIDLDLAAVLDKADKDHIDDGRGLGDAASYAFRGDWFWRTKPTTGGHIVISPR